VDLTDFDGPGQLPFICIGPAQRLTHAPTYQPTISTSAPTQSIFAPTENSRTAAPSITADQNTITPNHSPSESPSQYLLAMPSVSPGAVVGGDSFAPSVAGGTSFAPNMAGGTSFAPSVAGGNPGFHDSFVVT